MKSIGTPRRRRNLSKAFDNGPTQCLGFRDSIQTNSVQTEVRRFSLEEKNLSGGQQKRLSLAIILINRPDLLILDEPTNHLDLEMIEWLETYFAKHLFMVTHDRFFLERV
jgi:ATP-binding cassette subfamily F protein uup